MLDREFAIYFFYILINIETDRDAWKWIHYKSQKSYTVFPGIFKTQINSEAPHLVDEDTAKEKCDDLSDCVGILKTRADSNAELLYYLDMENFRISEEKITLIKLENVTKDLYIDGANAWEDIDICCPEHGQVNTRYILETVHDTMPRIECDITAEDFLTNYVKKRKPVILKNCTEDWIAQKEWSMRKLFSENEGKLMWRSDFFIQSNQFNKLKEMENLSGDILNEILDNNGTIH